MNQLQNYIISPAEPRLVLRSTRSLKLELAVKSRQLLKKQVWKNAKRTGLLRGVSKSQ